MLALYQCISGLENKMKTGLFSLHKVIKVPLPTSDLTKQSIILFYSRLPTPSKIFSFHFSFAINFP